MELPPDSAIQFLGLYPDDSSNNGKIRIHNVIHCSLVFNCKNWKQPNAHAQESH